MCIKQLPGLILNPLSILAISHCRLQVVNMGLGILEDTHLVNVPGTCLFNDDPNAIALSAYEGVDLAALKHASGRDSHIVLVPQPTDDPNDPLNWPRWKKHMVSQLAISTSSTASLISLYHEVFFVLYVLFSTVMETYIRPLPQSIWK